MTPEPGRRGLPPPLLRLGRLLGLALVLAAASSAPAPAIAPWPDGPRPTAAIEPLVVDPAVAADREGWLVASGRGPLRWRPVGGRGWRPAWPGRIVPYGSEVEIAGAGAWASLAAGGARMTLHGDGHAVLLRPRDASGAGGPLRVQQDRGLAHYRVGPPAVHPRFEVVTPMLVTTVKGTTFDITVDHEKVEVRVEQGLVVVTPRARAGTTTPPPSDVAAGQGYRLLAATAAPELFRLSDGGTAGRTATHPLWLTVAAAALAALVGLASFALLGRDGAVLAGALWQRWQHRPGGKAKRRRKMLRAGGG